MKKKSELVIKGFTPSTKAIDVKVPENYTDEFHNTIRMIRFVSQAYSLLNLASVYVEDAVNQRDGADIWIENFYKLWTKVFVNDAMDGLLDDDLEKLDRQLEDWSDIWDFCPPDLEDEA